MRILVILAVLTATSASALTVRPSSGRAPLAVSADSDADEDFACEWDFRDGTTESGALEVVHVYERPGRYTLAMACQDPDSTFVLRGTKTIVVSDALSPTTTTMVETPDTSSTTSTTLPPPTASAPARFTAADVGLHFPSSQEIRWDPRDGSRANQYVAMVRASTLHFVVLPRVIRAMRDIPSCHAATAGVVSLVRDVVGKFFILYSIRPLDDGGPYQFRPNYLWDIPQNLFAKFHACLLSDPADNATHPALTPAIMQLADVRVEDRKLVAGDESYVKVPRQDHTDTTRQLRDGTLNPRVSERPLTRQQAALLMDTHRLHREHATAFLAHDYARADAIAPKVAAAHLAFESSARDPNEQTLFTMIFTGDVDWNRPLEEIDALTRQTDEWHQRWMDCLMGQSTPDLVCAWRANMGHARAHFLRAVYVPGMVIRTVCDGDIHYCPVTGD